VQDEIILKILTELQVKLTGGETTRILTKGTDNLEAYLKFLQGYFTTWMNNPNDNVYAQQMFKEAIALDPEYVEAYAFLAYTCLVDVRYGRIKSRQESVDQAFNLVRKALEIDESNAMGLHVLSAVYLFQGRYEEAIAKAKQAYDLAPNNCEVVQRLGTNLSQAGRPEEAIPYFEKALSLNPISPFLSLAVLGYTYSDMGKYDMAISFLEKAININPDSSIALLALAACYAAVEREEEAHACVARVLKIDPTVTIEKLITGSPKRNKILLKKRAGLLRKAGLPE
jgi:adenylate cyclase